MEKKCLFCRIVSKEEPSYSVMEDAKHLAFLDVFPLIEGQTIVVPKEHHGGYAFDMPEEELKDLMSFTQKVAKRLDSQLGAERCMQVLQGYAIDHVHTKLFPVKTLKAKVVDEKMYRSLVMTLRESWYSGVIISMSGRDRESDEKLKKLSEKIEGR